ncbi:hypothetical protein, partial [Streptomyces sp. GSL17-113]|uniref:hypothetical protein n=1 Tax=Streptomyces sp. GSL17-113 TaxID=3115365 RepID=UPI002E7A3959
DTTPRTALGVLARTHYAQKFAATRSTLHTEGESAAHLTALILHTHPGDAPQPRMTPQPGDHDPYAVTLATITRVVSTGRQLAAALHHTLHNA